MRGKDCDIKSSPFSTTWKGKELLGRNTGQKLGIENRLVETKACAHLGLLQRFLSQIIGVPLYGVICDVFSNLVELSK